MQKIFRYPLAIIVVLLGITVYLGLQIPNIVINNNIEIFIPKNDPSRLAYNRVKETYGSQNLVDIAFAVNRENVFTVDNIRLISELTGKIEQLPHVDSVTSLTNADYIEGTPDGMRATSLLEDFTGSPQDITRLKQRLFSWRSMYQGNLVSDDFRSTQIIVRLDPDVGTDAREAFYVAAKALLAGYDAPDRSFYVAGDPVVTVLLKDAMMGDITYLVPLVVLVVLLVLFFAFRNPGGVFLPTLTVLMSTTWAVGIMALLGIYFSMISTVIPVLLIAVGSAYVIHLFNSYYDSLLEAGAGGTAEEHREMVFAALRRVGKPVILSALTTAAGFASIATSSITPMRYFGIANAIGVVAALIITLLLVPSILLLRHRALKGHATRSRRDTREGANRALLGFYNYFTRQNARIVVFSFIIVGVSVFGLTRIVADNSMIEYFQRDSEIRVADRFIRAHFAGTKTFSIVVRGKKKGDLTHPDILAAMDGLSEYLQTSDPEVGRVLSFSDFVKRMNQVMHVPEDASAAAATPVAAEGSNTAGTGNTAGQGTAPSSFFSEQGSQPGSFFSENSSPPQVTGTGSDGTTGTGNTAGTGDPADTAAAGNTAGPGDNVAPAGTAAAGNDTARNYRHFIQTLNASLSNASGFNITAADLVDLVNRRENYQGAAYNEIPTDPSKYPVADQAGLANLISQYLLLYSGNLSDFANDALEPSEARMLVQLRASNTLTADRVKSEVIAYAQHYFPDGYDVSVAGFADMESAVNRLVVHSQIMSILAALLVVFVIVAISYRSAIAGIYGIIPLFFAILINFGVMGLFNIKLNIATAMVASIAIGIGVDYTIHFLSAYSYERGLQDDLAEVTKRTLLTTGKAIAFNAISVGAGFAVLLLSNFNPLRFVGALVALTMLTSSLAAMTILPVLLNIFKPQFVRKQTQQRTT